MQRFLTDVPVEEEILIWSLGWDVSELRLLGKSLCSSTLSTAGEGTYLMGEINRHGPALDEHHAHGLFSSLHPFF